MITTIATHSFLEITAEDMQVTVFKDDDKREINKLIEEFEEVIELLKEYKNER